MAGREQPFDFGAWRVDPARGVLLGLTDGTEVRLEPRLMDLLLLFAGSTGRVLGKEEIVASVWSGRAIGDDTLAAAVSRLRGALGERPERRYIETLPKRGYRLVLPGPALAAGGHPSQAAVTAPDVNAKAAALVAQGHAALASPFPASQAQARLCFEAAVREAPGWAQAHTGLAQALVSQVLGGQGSGLTTGARASAQAAVAIDPGLAAGWSVFGLSILLADRDFSAADEALRRALALDPDLASAHRHRAFGLAALGRFAEAEREGRRAVELEPVALATRGQLLQILLTARRYRHAVTAANETLQLSPLSSEGWYAKGWACVLSGEEAAGIDALLKGLELWGLPSDQLARLGTLGASGGVPAVCAAGADLFQAQTLMFIPRHTDIAFLRAAAAQPDQAFAALEAAAPLDDPYLTLLPWLPYCDPLRDDPRWPRLLERVRLIR